MGHYIIKELPGPHWSNMVQVTGFGRGTDSISETSFEEVNELYPFDFI